MPVPKNTIPSAVTDAAKDGLLDLVTDYVLDGFSDLYFAATDLPTFIADTGPIVAAAQPTRQIGRLACRSYARGGGPQNLPGFDAVWSGICGPYLDSIGESPSPGAGVSAPFSGGQCAGVNYQIAWSWSAGSFNSGPQTAQRVGPISYNRNGSGIPGCGPDESYNVLTLVDGTGQSPLSLYAGCGARLNNLSVTPVGGGADNCGNPPPEYDPPKIKPGLPMVPKTPIDFPGVGPIGVNINFNPDGTLNVELPDVGVEVDVPIDFGDEGGGGGDGGPSGPSDGPPGDVGQPGTPQTTGAGGDAEGAAPAGSVLVGVRVEVLAFPAYRDKGEGEVFRGAYYLYMGTPGLLDLDRGGAVVRADQFFFAEKDNLTAWRISANNGFNLRSTPYYRAVA